MFPFVMIFDIIGQLYKNFKKRVGLALKKFEIDGKKHAISYEIVNKDKRKDIIFLHGWGSDKALMMKAFSRYFGDFRHIYVDMPGFGKSPNEKILNSNDYATILDHFFKEIGAQKEIVVGHSFGGKVATLLGPGLLVLLSSAGILWPKPLKVRAKIALYKLLKPFGKNFRHLFVSEDAKGMSETMYETFKRVVDEDFAPIFANYPGRALIVWGREDSPTPLKSGKKINELIKNSRLEVLEGDHYFFMDKGAIIEKLIKEEYERL